jgi:hypothetical protein
MVAPRSIFGAGSVTGSGNINGTSGGGGGGGNTITVLSSLLSVPSFVQTYYYQDSDFGFITNFVDVFSQADEDYFNTIPVGSLVSVSEPGAQYATFIIQKTANVINFGVQMAFISTFVDGPEFTTQFGPYQLQTPPLPLAG